MPLRWSGYSLLMRVYNHVAPPEPRFQRKRGSRSIRKAWIDAFAGMTKVVWSADVCFRLLILSVETQC